MAVLEEGLYSYLSAQSGITALVGTRIYPIWMPQGVTLPCLTYQRMSTEYHLTHDTSGLSQLSAVRIQFVAYAETLKAAKGITDQVRSALNGKKGSIGTSSSAVTIRAALAENETTDYFMDAEIYRVNADYYVWLEE